MRTTGWFVAVVTALTLAAPASAATTFHVNSTADPGTGTCDVTECTLREAIIAANADSAADTIDFTNVATGDNTIFLDTTPLPAITQPVTIDGTTHPDFSTGFPGLAIDGSGLSSGDGLHIQAASTVKGLGIGGFPGNGITIDTANGSVIQGNVIGTPYGDVTGSAISVSSSSNIIGGVAAGAANELSAGKNGVTVVSGTGNSIRGNSWGSFTGQAIDLANDGRTANDALDADSGANNRQNFPTLTSMTLGAGTVSFGGTLSAAANTQYTLDFYAAGGCAGGNTEYLGSDTVTTNGSGNATVSSTLLASPSGEFGVATAPDPAGNTSELSDAVDTNPNPVAGITATCSPLAVAQAMAADSSTITGASYVTQPPQGRPNAIGTGSFAGFPTSGGSYGVLSSGSAAHLAPGQSSGGSDGGGNVRGDTDFDVTVLKVDMNVPAQANCLTIDFRFLSDEYPQFVNSSFNDAFIAELDSTTWTTSGSTISAPNNFAFDPSNDVISINSTGNTAMTHAATAGTGYDGGDGTNGGATPLLHASKVVTSGAHSLYLSIFDQGDHILDSGVEVDNLRFSTLAPAACASGATSDVTPPTVTLATPADGSTTNDTTPTYSGTAGTATGDLDTITVKIYAGTTATGSPVQTITTTKTGGTWTVDGSTPLAPGTYTAQAEQSDSGGNTGFSSANTFTVSDDPLASINDVTVTEGDSGTVDATFTVSLSKTSANTVTVDYATADGTAVQPGDYTSNSGTVTFLPGDTSEQVTVVVKGDTIDENDETFTVGLSNPNNAEIDDASGLGTITDDDGPPSVSVSDQTVTEGNSGTTDAVFTVSLSAASGKTVTVHAATSDGTATQPSDYASTSGQVQFAPGQTSRTFSVPVNGDTTIEPDETFTVTLSSPSNTTLNDATATGTIVNDDSAPPPVVPSISIGNTTVNPEGDTGTKPATFTVSLSSATTQTVSVKFATADGTATAPADYAAAGGTLTFAPGDTSKTVTVDVAGDTLDESDETFKVQLSDPVNGTLGTAQGTGTIVDDDATPVVKPPGGVPTDGVFCGTQHRGRCHGLQFTAQFQDAPGNASWTFDVFNPNPGKKGRAVGAKVRFIRVGTLRKPIKSSAPVKVTFKLTGSKANAALRKIRKGKLKRLRITTTFTSSTGKKSKTVSVVKLR
jgi:CSLREA domain-containing protein